MAITRPLCRAKRPTGGRRRRRPSPATRRRTGPGASQEASPVTLNSPTSYFDGPPLVSCAAYCVHEGRLTEPVDTFAHPFWDAVRSRVAEKSMEMRRQGFSGAAMLPWSELEYTGVSEKLDELDKRFQIRA